MLRLRHISVVLALLVGALPLFADKNDRGIVRIQSDTVHFAIKGNVIFGGGVSLSHTGSNNYSLAFVDKINYFGYSLSVKPVVMWCVADDLAIGMAPGYTRNLVNLASANLAIESVSVDIQNFYSLSHKYGADLFVRKFLPIGRTGRFAIFVDGTLGFKGGQAKVTDRQGKKIYGTYETSYSVALGVNPGLSAYITDRFNLAAGLGILGVDFSWTNQVHNQVAQGRRSGFGASYIVNLLSLSVSALWTF